MVVTYGDQTLRFYSSFTVLGGFSGEALPGELEPDWIWLRSNSPALKGNADVRAWVREHVDTRQYDTIALPVPDRSFELREDPHDYWHLREGSWPRVTVLHRRKPQGSAAINLPVSRSAGLSAAARCQSGVPPIADPPFPQPPTPAFKYTNAAGRAPRG